jgi:hypothetical protein
MSKETIVQSISRLKQMRHDVATSGASEDVMFEIFRNLDIVIDSLTIAVGSDYGAYNGPCAHCECPEAHK